MNPEKMRSEYGKMVYLLQDSQSPDVREMLSIKLVRPLRTAYALLSETEKGLDMLNDPLMHTATAEIMHEGKPRHEVQREIKQKERARETLSKKYASRDLSSEEILHVLYSIADNNAYLRYNRDPVDEMLTFLSEMFDPKTPEEGFSLGISTGMEGARLSHNHARQYSYVSQSLMLWREVANDMFKLWYLAEQDLLRDSNRYQLTNTGQGLNRVQQVAGQQEQGTKSNQRVTQTDTGSAITKPYPGQAIRNQSQNGASKSIEPGNPFPTPEVPTRGPIVNHGSDLDQHIPKKEKQFYRSKGIPAIPGKHLCTKIQGLYEGQERKELAGQHQ